MIAQTLRDKVFIPEAHSFSVKANPDISISFSAFAKLKSEISFS